MQDWENQSLIEIHVVLKTAKKNLHGKSVVPSLHMIRAEGVKKKPWKNLKGVSMEKKKIPPPLKKESVAKDVVEFTSVIMWREWTCRFRSPWYPNRVWKLQRSIYGLKEASRSLNMRFDEKIKEFGFVENIEEPCVYKRIEEHKVVFLILYLDDILRIGNDIPMLKGVKAWLKRCFAMKYLREAAYILWIQIYRDRSKRILGLSQSTYIDKVLTRFKMNNSKKGMKRGFQKDHGVEHWTIVKNILGYLRMIKDMFLVYVGMKYELSVKGYTNASFQTDRDDTKSQSVYVFIMNGWAVAWRSSKQDTIAMSSTKVEYIVVSEAAQVIKVDTDDNNVDPLTKALPCDKHDVHVNGMELYFVGLESS
ncbi:putative RNA-directed DNA polymerase [Tanacetum coccineum]